MKSLTLVFLALVLTSQVASAGPLNGFSSGTYSMKTKMSLGGPLRNWAFRRVFGPIVGGEINLNQGPEDQEVIITAESVTFDRLTLPLSGCIRTETDRDMFDEYCVRDEDSSSVSIRHREMREVYWQDAPEVVETSSYKISKLGRKKFKIVSRRGSESETYTFSVK